MLTLHAQYKNTDRPPRGRRLEFFLHELAEEPLKTYLARIETQSGTHTITLKAASIEEAVSALQARVHTGKDRSATYILQEQLRPDQLNAIDGLAGATGVLIVCLLALVLADHHLRKWLKR